MSRLWCHWRPPPALDAAAVGGVVELGRQSTGYGRRTCSAVALAVVGGTAGESDPCCAEPLTWPLVQPAAVFAPGLSSLAMLVAQASSSLTVG